MIKILIDCFGGDHSPEANVDGALAAMTNNSDLYLILTGDETTLQNYLKTKTYDALRLEIVHAPEVIGCEERPYESGWDGIGKSGIKDFGRHFGAICHQNRAMDWH